MYTSMIFIMIIIIIIMLVVTISLLKRKNWECFYIENEILYLPSLFVKEIPLSNIRNIEFETFRSRGSYSGIAVSTPEAQFSSSISKKPIQFLEWLKELKFISLSFRALLSSLMIYPF